MAVYDCQCGMMISTSSERPQCLRCHRELGPADAAEGKDPRPAAEFSAVPVIAYLVHFCQVPIPYGLNNRSVFLPAQAGSAI